MKKLKVLRSQVAGVDGLIVRLLAKRMMLSTQIGKFKRDVELPVCDSLQRTKVLCRNRNLGKRLGLRRTFVTQIFRAIHNESVRVQRRAR